MDEMDGKCRKCKNYGSKICSRCDMYYDEFDPMDDQPQTNADRIRAMTDEELADYLRYYSDSYARYDMDWLDWLKEEAKDGE